MTQAQQQIHTCAKCDAQTEQQQAIANDYKCQQCSSELAHLDIAANGAIRGVFGWLKETGAVIDSRYQVETVLGKGGFGATYLVKDLRVQGKSWALKEIPEILFDEYEVSLLSQLDHPSVPIIVDRFSENDMVYLVLKFGGTKTLAGICKQQQQVTYQTLKPWLIQLADVLTYLHSRNPPIIHRDLKPENILLDNEDRVMLIDFGIAKESIANTATRTLGRAASHGFSPPEQVMGTGTDIRSDIYSLAATLYFALVGKSPVPAHERVAGAVLQAPSELVSAIPEAANTMIMQALNLNINERPATIAEFLVAFTGANFTTEEQANKTVQISDIQFGPVLNSKTSRSTPLNQQSATPVQKNKQSKLVGVIIALLLMISLAAAGGYWYFNGLADNSSDAEIVKLSVDKTLPAKSTSAEVSLPTTIQPQLTKPTETAPVATSPQTDNSSVVVPIESTPQAVPATKSGPSALDILTQKLEAQDSVEAKLKAEAEVKAAAKKAEASAKKERMRKAIANLEKKQRKAKAARAKKAAAAKTQARAFKPTPAAKQPNWGNQTQGTF